MTVNSHDKDVLVLNVTMKLPKRNYENPGYKQTTIKTDLSFQAQILQIVNSAHLSLTHDNVISKRTMGL